jgi:hypothetical protein
MGVAIASGQPFIPGAEYVYQVAGLGTAFDMGDCPRKYPGVAVADRFFTAFF